MLTQSRSLIRIPRPKQHSTSWQCQFYAHIKVTWQISAKFFTVAMKETAMNWRMVHCQEAIALSTEQVGCHHLWSSLTWIEWNMFTVMDTAELRWTLKLNTHTNIQIFQLLFSFIRSHVAVKIIRGEILDNLYSLVLIKRGFLQRNKLLCPTVMFDNYVEHWLAQQAYKWHTFERKQLLHHASTMGFTW